MKERSFQRSFLDVLNRWYGSAQESLSAEYMEQANYYAATFAETLDKNDVRPDVGLAAGVAFVRALMMCAILEMGEDELGRKLRAVEGGDDHVH